MLILSLAVTGIGLGLLYGLGGIAFNVIFSTTKVFDLSIGATFLVGGYAYYALRVQLGIASPLAVTGALVAATASGVVFYMIIYRTISRKSGGGFFAYFVASLGVVTVIANALAIPFGNTRVFDTGNALTEHVSIGSSLSFPRGDLIIIAVVLVVWLAFELLLRRTDIGVHFRALAEDRDLFVVLGAKNSKYWTLAFALGSLFMGIDGLLMFQMLGMAPGDGLVIGTLAIAAMLVGGLGSYRGSLLGGLVLGIVESVSLRWLSGAWEEAIAFAVLLLVMMMRPRGILGRSGD